MEYPYNDKYMTYDYDFHRYYLTPEAVTELLNIDLSMLDPIYSFSKGSNELMFLKEISSDIYNEIYERSSNFLVSEFIIAKSESGRRIVREAMLEQVKYAVVNGSIAQYSGVDFKKNTVGDSARSRILAPNAERVLNRIIPEMGVSLVYQGQYQSIIKLGDYEHYRY